MNINLEGEKLLRLALRFRSVGVCSFFVLVFRMRAGFCFYLLVSGFLPINVILLAKALEQGQHELAWILILLVNLGGLATVRLLSFLTIKDKPSSFRIKSAAPIDESILVYVITYVPLLLDVDFSSLSGLVSLLVFYVVMSIVFVRSRTLFVNPIFMILGWRFFEGTIVSEGEDSPVLLITKRRIIEGGCNYKLRELSNLGTYIVY